MELIRTAMTRLTLDRIKHGKLPCLVAYSSWCPWLPKGSGLASTVSTASSGKPAEKQNYSSYLWHLTYYHQTQGTLNILSSATRNCSLFSPTDIIIFYLLWINTERGGPFAYQLAKLYLKIMWVFRSSCKYKTIQTNGTPQHIRGRSSYANLQPWKIQSN